MFSIPQIQEICSALRSQALLRYENRSAKQNSEAEVEEVPVIVPDGLELVENEKGLSVKTTVPRERFEPILAFTGEIASAEASNPLALQIDEDLFITNSKDDPNRIDDYVNHSCEPNCFVFFEKSGMPSLVTLRELAQGEELTFDYNTTEYDMFPSVELQSNFDCLCGTQSCVGHVRGFNSLTLEQKIRISPYLSPFLRGKLELQLDELNLLLFNRSLNADQPEAGRLRQKG